MSILDEAVYIAHSANALEKAMNPAISLKLWINSAADCTIRPSCANHSRRRKN